MVTFYLRESSNGSDRIYVRVTVRRGHQYRYFTGWSLPVNAKWDKRNGRLAQSRVHAFQQLNVQLARLRMFIEMRELGANEEDKVRDRAFYKALLDEFRADRPLHEPEVRKTLVWAFKGFIEHHESPLTPSNERLTPGTLKTYKTGLSFLSSSRLGSTLLTEVDMEWYRRFVSRAEGGGSHKSALSKNYIGKLVKLVKRVIRFAENQGAEVNPAYRQREFKVLTEETTSVYLSETEIDRIRELDLENDKGLALTRDLFTLGCYSGLRYSDFTALSQSNVREYEGVRMFDVRSQKTGERVSIPIHPIVESILAQRNGDTPPFQSDQIMNRNLKILGALAGLDDDVEVERTEGGKRTARVVPKHELLVTHTARRSFCTNAYLSGLDSIDIMAISGHKTEAHFLRYIKVTREQRAKRISEHAFFQ
jgi:integrase